MRRLFITAIALATIAGGTAVAIANVAHPDSAWTVTRVIDGDTIDVQRNSTQERVRLAGIDTPERGQCGADEATQRLRDLIARSPNLKVRLDNSTPGSDANDRDRYGRLIRYVVTYGDPDPRGRDHAHADTGYTLIEEGLAVARYDSRDGYPKHALELAYREADALSPPAITC